MSRDLEGDGTHPMVCERKPMDDTPTGYAGGLFCSFRYLETGASSFI